MRLVRINSNREVPVFEKNQHGFTWTFPLAEVTPEVTPEVAKMLSIIMGEMTRAEIMKVMGLNDEKHFREHYQQAGIAAGVIEMTIPDRPKSRRQKYRLTEKGRRVRGHTND